MTGKGGELFLRCADLIASDRKGTPRDDGFHASLRAQQIECFKFVAAGLRSIVAALGG